MICYAKITNPQTKLCEVGIGTNAEFYKSIGMTQQDVEQAYDGNYYLLGHAPTKSIEMLKTEKLYQIQSWTANAIVSGFVSNCAGTTATFDSDIDTQITMQGIALNVNSEQFATEYPQGCPVRGYEDGSNIKTVFMLLPNQVLQFCADLSKHIGVQKQHGWELQQTVMQATTKEDLDLIIWE